MWHTWAILLRAVRGGIVPASVASDATIKEYGLDSEIRYLDALDYTYISDPMKVPIDVKNLTGFAGIVSNRSTCPSWSPPSSGAFTFYIPFERRDNHPVFWG